MPLRALVPAIVALAALAAALPAGAQSARIGEVQEVFFDAYGTPQAQPRRNLYVATPVFAQERVETVVNGGVAMIFADNTRFRVGPESVVTLDRFVYNPNATGGELALSLTKGTFRYISGKVPGPGVQLRTPSALIGIRGTDFFVSVLANGITLVNVISGIVTVQALAGGQPVEAGRLQAVTVAANGTMTVGAARPPTDPQLDPVGSGMPSGLPSRSQENSSSSN